MIETLVNTSHRAISVDGEEGLVLWTVVVFHPCSTVFFFFASLHAFQSYVRQLEPFSAISSPLATRVPITICLFLSTG